MINEKKLHVLYYYRYLKDYQESYQKTGDEVAYYILKIQSDSVIIDEQELLKIFTKMFSKENFKGRMIGPFDELHELNQFVAELLKKNDLEEAFLLSVNDFNRGLEFTNNVGDFSTLFEEYGRKLRADPVSKAKYSWF